MKKLKFFGKVLAALVLAGGILFSVTSCSQPAADVVNAITGNPTVNNLLGQLTVGTYTGSLTNVTATLGDKRVTFSWTNPTDENFCGVHIYKNTDTIPVADISADENSATVSNLTNGETYTFTLCPKGKESDGSIKIGKNPAYKTVTLERTPVDRDYVGKISDLTYSYGDGQVTFYWKNPADENFTGVKIYVGEELYATTQAEETSCVVEALDNGATYSFSFKACGKNAEGVEVDSLNVVQKRVKLPFISDEDYIGEISKVEYKVDDGQVTFTWINPDDTNFSGVAVYLGDVKKDDLEKDAESYTFTNLEVGEYTFKLMPRGKNRKGVVVDSLNSFTKTIHVEQVSRFGFVGRGYNAITGEYFSTAGSGLKARIIDLSSDFKPSVEPINTTDTKYSAGTSIESYKKSWNASVGLSVGYGGFSGSVSSDFGGSEEFSAETSFASANGVYNKAKESFSPDQKEEIKDHLNAGFVKAVNEWPVERLFREYGTHVMLSTTVGGRFSMNYQYQNTSGKKSSELKVAVQASYGSISGEGSYGQSQENTFSNSNCSIIGYTRGGKSLKSITSIEDAKDVWDEWVDSLDADESDGTCLWSLIDSEGTIAEEDITGVWNFASSDSRKTDIYNYYVACLEANANALGNLQQKKGVLSVKLCSMQCTDYSDADKVSGASEFKWEIKAFGKVLESRWVSGDDHYVVMNKTDKEYYSFKDNHSNTGKVNAVGGVNLNPANTYVTTFNVAKTEPATMDMTMKFRAEEYDKTGSNDSVGDQTRIFTYDKTTNTWTHQGTAIPPDGTDKLFEWSMSGDGNGLTLRYYVSWLFVED